MRQFLDFAPRLGRVCGHTFVKDWVTEDAPVVDLGMYNGDFARYITKKFPGVRVYGCEPVPSLCERLRPEFAGRVLNVAVGPKTQVTQLALYKNTCASVVFSNLEGDHQVTTVRMLSFEDLCCSLGLSRIGLLKVDIEGAEVAMFAESSDAVLGSCDQITVEYHDFIDRNQVNDVKRSISRFKALGFKAYK